MNRRQTLSVCIIARNEAATLHRALESVREVADEKIVVDTGSSDATMAIARERGARVYEENWRDDFSWARNQAIDKARCDWILFLDADEKLRSGQKKPLRRLLQSSEDAWFVQIRSPLAREQSGQVFTNYFERLFRRRPDVRFSGRVHEQIGPALQRVGAHVGTSDLILDHSGYAVDQAHSDIKLRRNLQLLMLDLANRQQVGYVHFHLGETYSLLRDPHAALPHYRQALSCQDLTPQYQIATHQNLASAALKLGHLEMAVEHASRALQSEPRAQSARLVRAAAFLKSGQLDKATTDLDDYLRACDQRTSSALSFGMEPDPSRALRIRGECHLRAGRIDQAQADARRILAQQPDWAGGWRLQGRIHVAAGELQAAATSFEAALGIDPDAEATWIELVQLHLSRDDRQAARGVFTEANQHVRSAELHRLQGHLNLLEGRWNEALSDYQQVLTLLPNDPQALRRVTGLYQKLGRTQEARACLEKLNGGLPMKEVSQ